MRTLSPPTQGKSTRPAWQAAYLKWMKAVNHPDLSKSNWHAQQFRERESRLSGTP